MDPSIVQVDRDWTINTLRDLVRINSVNPSLVPGGAGESEIAHYIGWSLEAAGLDIEYLEPQPGRISVVGTWKGQGGGRSLMLNAHVDTVGVDEMAEPFSGAIRDGRLYGRGAYDMKGSLAACMAAAKALADAGATLDGDLLVAAVADEEYESLGTADVIAHRRVDGAVVAEPTSLDICLAHKGFSWIEVETIGRAAHGSRFVEGIDANIRMGRFLAELDKLEQQLRASPPHPLVGPPSLHAATLAGGTGLSTYAARCLLQVERRTIPGETEAQVLSELQALVDRLSAVDPTFQAHIRPVCVREPFEVSPQAAIVRALQSAAKQVLGRAVPFVGDTPWMDAALLASGGVETVVFGPTGGGAHAKEEWVEIESVITLGNVLVQAAVQYCG